MECTEALRKLAADAASGDLVFPTHAHVALQIRLALDDPEIHLDKVATLVQGEPLLAAKVVGVANSVVFNRSGQAVADVRVAVRRLGITTIRAMATAVILKQLSATRSAAYEAIATRLWEHSAHVAALSFILAKKVSKQNADKAMFAGIVHDLVYFFLISRTKDHPELVHAGLDEAWLATGEVLVQGAVLKALAIPEEISTAIVGMRTGKISLPPRSLADILVLANCLSPILNPFENASRATQREEILALSTQIIPDRTLTELLDDSAEELTTLMTALTT